MASGGDEQGNCGCAVPVRGHEARALAGLALLATLLRRRRR
jgi:MYXO-CTERM domain-containing protein